MRYLDDNLDTWGQVSVSTWSNYFIATFRCSNLGGLATDLSMFSFVTLSASITIHSLMAIRKERALPWKDEFTIRVTQQKHEEPSLATNWDIIVGSSLVMMLALLEDKQFWRGSIVMYLICKVLLIFWF